MAQLCVPGEAPALRAVTRLNTALGMQKIVPSSLHPLTAFAMSTAACILWFGLLITAASDVPIALHVAWFLAPVAVCGGFQFAATRKAALPSLRGAFQVVTAALFSPVLAALALWLVLVVALGHGE